MSNVFRRLQTSKSSHQLVVAAAVAIRRLLATSFGALSSTAVLGGGLAATATTVVPVNRSLNEEGRSDFAGREEPDVLQDRDRDDRLPGLEVGEQLTRDQGRGPSWRGIGNSHVGANNTM